eukprot:4414912-Amphidinium_carterae.2
MKRLHKVAQVRLCMASIWSKKENENKPLQHRTIDMHCEMHCELAELLWQYCRKFLSYKRTHAMSQNVYQCVSVVVLSERCCRCPLAWRSGGWHQGPVQG